MRKAAPPDRYRRLSLLGEGANGRVSLVEDASSPGSRLALKELPRSDRTAIAELRNEFATLATLRHPGIPRVFVFDRHPVTQLPRFSLEFIKGRALLDASAAASSADVIGFLSQVLQVLGFLHEFGIVHRDLKPANLVVRDHSRLGFQVALLDFGLAVAREEPKRMPTGTLPYVAPELLFGEPATPRSDLYALGTVAHELVHGRPPFRPDTSDLASFMDAVREGKRIRPSCPDSYPSELGTWIEQLLCPDPTARLATAEEALARLNDACGTTYVTDTPTARAARLASGAAPGRESISTELLSRLERPPSGHVIWITGEPGSGKTRLLDWLEAEAVRKGWWIHRLSVDRQDDATPGFEIDPGPTVTLLDEAERASRSLVNRILGNEQTTSMPALTVLALRQHDVRDSRLRSLLESTDLFENSTRFHLAPLDERGVGQLFKRATGGKSTSKQIIEPVLEKSEGNPGLAVPMVIGGRRSSAQDTQAAFDDTFRSRIRSLPTRDRRWLEALCVLGGPISRVTVDELGEFDRAIDLEALHNSELITFSSAGWLPASRRVAKIVLEALSSDRRHDLYRSAAELVSRDGESSAGVLAHLWREAGDTEKSIDSALAAAACAKEPSDAALWYRFAATLLKRRDSRRQAIRRRQGLAAFQSGRFRVAASALATAARLASTDVERVEQLALRARALSALRKLRAARECARNARDIADHVESDDAKAAAGYALALANYVSGDYRAAHHAALGASDSSLQVASTALKAEVQALLGLIETSLGNHESAERHLERGLELTDRAKDPEVHANLLIGLARVYSRQRRLEKALDTQLLALEHVRGAGLNAKATAILQNRANLLLTKGHLDQALEAANDSSQLAAHHGHRTGWLLSEMIRAEILSSSGRPSAGSAILRRILEDPNSNMEPGALDYARLTLAECLLRLPQPLRCEIDEQLYKVVTRSSQDPRVQAATLATRLETEARFQDPSPDTWGRWLTFLDTHDVEPALRIRAVTARARLDLQADDPASAITHAGEATELADENALPLLAAGAWSVLSEAHEARNESAEAEHALQQGKARLDDAAGRIEDADMRRDLLARPDFERLRRAADAAADAGPKAGQQPDRLLALYEMIHALNSETDPDLVLESILDMALRVVGAERGLILLRRPGTDEYTVRLARNLERETIEDAARFSRKVVLQSGSGRAVLAMDTRDGETLSEYKSLGLYGIRSVICVPLRSRGEIVGAVYLDDRREGGMFTPEDLRFLEAFADHAALALRNAQERRELERRNEALQAAAESRSEFAGIVGRSRPMQRVFDLIKKAAEVPLPVMVQGESGTGKELVARAIHFNGPRKKAVFLSENCAAIPETLLESELFGHVKGAFTGAERDRQGLFEQADGGSLFLDEVGDMSAAMQARLLRVLQEGELRRVGGNHPVRVDVRVIAATHRDLAEEVEAGRFREDLFYRLNVLSIHLPPLRERAGDVGLLIDHLLRGIARSRGRAVPPVTGEVADLLERYHWPGNVRQLENTLQRLVVLAGDQPIDRALLDGDPALARTLLAETREPSPMLSLAQQEREQILTALEATGGNKARAARLLGISRATIFRKIKDLDLK